MESMDYLQTRLEALLANKKALWTITNDAEREHVSHMLNEEIERIRAMIRAFPPLAICGNEG